MLVLILPVQTLEDVKDSDSIIESFFSECNLAGPEKCALYSATGLETIRRTYHGTLKRLLYDPVAVPAQQNFGPDIITYQDVMELVKSAVYSPRPGFSTLATAIHDLSLGNGTKLAVYKKINTPVTCRSPLCEKKPWSHSCYDPSFVSVII